MTPPDGYELIDAGDGRRLERFGPRVVDRPAPGASDARLGEREAWAAADLRFDRETGWSGRDRSPWTITLDAVTLELRPAAAGQLGVFPDHAVFWPWLRRLQGEAVAPARVLHLFASTGATTLTLAAAGAEVTHVDAARSAVARARRNAELSGLSDRPVRWIVDDALAYARREARRDRRYSGVVLDPPSYGHGPDGRRWQLDAALPELLDAVAAVAADDAFVLLTAHATGLAPGDLGRALGDAFDGRTAWLNTSTIELTATSGAILSLGAAARMIRG